MMLLCLTLIHNLYVHRHYDACCFLSFIRNVAAYACLDKDVEPDPSKLMMLFLMYC